MEFTFGEFNNAGGGMYPESLPGELARVTLRECSGRDEGGAVCPDVQGIVLLKVIEGYEVRPFHFQTHRRWDPKEVWRVVQKNFIGEPMKFSKMPAFIWRDISSAYHFDCDSAGAEIEVVGDPNPEWLVKEIGWDKNRNGFAEIVLASLEQLLAESLTEEPVCPSLNGVWLERSQIDVRSLALKRYGDWSEREYFADPRPPIIIEEGDYWREGVVYRSVSLHGRLIAKIPISQWNTWKRAFLKSK